MLLLEVQERIHRLAGSREFRFVICSLARGSSQPAWIPCGNCTTGAAAGKASQGHAAAAAPARSICMVPTRHQTGPDRGMARTKLQARPSLPGGLLSIPQ